MRSSPRSSGCWRCARTRTTAARRAAAPSTERFAHTNAMAKTQKKTKTPVKPKKALRAVARDRVPRAVAAVQETRGKLERVKMPPPSAKGMRADGGAADESNEGKYVYCIIKAEEALSFGPLGI